MKTKISPFKPKEYDAIIAESQFKTLNPNKKKKIGSYSFNCEFHTPKSILAWAKGRGKALKKMAEAKAQEKIKQ
jgi:hypothetical protein